MAEAYDPAHEGAQTKFDARMSYATIYKWTRYWVPNTACRMRLTSCCSSFNIKHPSFG